MEFLGSIDTTGIQNLILSFFKTLPELDLKAIDLDFLPGLLTAIAPIWNPIWAEINELLNAWFGF